MEKRIKIVWGLSIVTMMLIMCSQIYWLYNQYGYNYTKNESRLMTDCSQIIMQEENIRYSQYLKAHKNDSTRINMQSRFLFETNPLTDKRKVHSKFTWYFNDGSKPKIIEKDELESSDAMIIESRFKADKIKPFDIRVIDSLLRKKGYGAARNFCFIHQKDFEMKPVFTKTGSRGNTVHVVYSTNPLDKRAVTFDVKVPVSSVLSVMAWQLASSLLLMFVLAFCLIYQIRTIMIQKRIDNIRHEFMKNMIYEMKQPPADEPSQDEAVNIGGTEFYYSLNELRHGLEKTIITSRQAEILKMLADNRNDVVSREDILKNVWGDDSFANSQALNVQVTYLRRALKSDTTVSIEAIIKKGYILKTE